MDTSVWIDHFHTKSGSLVALLEKDEIATHPFVVGELACGNLSKRKEIIALLHALPSVHKAEDDEILLFLDRHALMGRGIGLVDAHLLVSCHLDRCRLWTSDKRLHDIANEMGIAYV